MTNHLKRIAAPKTWNIDRKVRTFIIKPSSGGTSVRLGLPLTVIIRDILHFANTAGEVKKILNNKQVLVNAKRRNDHKYLVGLFDVISFVEINKYFKLIQENNGKLGLTEIPQEESESKISKIVGKTMLQKGKLQYNLHDGVNLVYNKEAKVGDSLLLLLPNFEVKEILPLKSGAKVMLTGGRYGGSVGKLKEIKNNQAICLVNKEEIETAKRYLFVIK